MAWLKEKLVVFNSSPSRLTSNLVANFIGQGWVAVMSLAFIPLYIKFLGVESYGLIGLFALLLSLARVLDMGMTPMLGREMARFTSGSRDPQSIRDLLRSIEYLVAGVSSLIIVIVGIAATPIATMWLQSESLAPSVVIQALQIMGFVIGLRFVEGIYRSAIIGLQRQVLFNTINSLMATFRGLGTVGILAFVSPTISAFFIWQGLVSIATLGILAWTTYQALPAGNRSGKFSVPLLRGVGRFAGGMTAFTLSALIFSSIDKVLLSSMLTLSDFGLYSLAVTLAGSLFMLVGPVTNSILS